MTTLNAWPIDETIVNRRGLLLVRATIREWLWCQEIFRFLLHPLTPLVKCVLIIDDFCSCPADDVRIDALLSLIDERHGQHSVAVASQLSIPDWHAALGGAHAADAIIDRLVPGQSRIELMGKSLRLGKAGPDEL